MLTEQKIAEIQRDLDQVLAEFSSKHGIVAGKSALRWNSASFKAEIIFSDGESAIEGVDPRYLVDLRKNGFRHGLKAEMIGTQLRLNAPRGVSPMFKFVGMRASKAVCINLENGKPYLWDAGFIANQISLQTPKG